MGAARFTSSVAIGPRELPHASAGLWRRVILDGGLPLLMSLALVGAATLGLLLIGRFFPVNLAPIVYLIPVMVAASRWGTWPAIVAAIASAASADFFFFPPYYSFRLDDPQAAIDLSLFLLVALVSGDLHRGCAAKRKRCVAAKTSCDISTASRGGWRPATPSRTWLKPFRII